MGSFQWLLVGSQWVLMEWLRFFAGASLMLGAFRGNPRNHGTEKPSKVTPLNARKLETQNPVYLLEGYLVSSQFLGGLCIADVGLRVLA